MKTDITTELKQLRLYGMADAWGELTDPGSSLEFTTAKGLMEHLLQAETNDRVIRSIRYQLHAARFPNHRDLAGFDFSQSKVDETLMSRLSSMEFTDDAQNIVLIGGTGTGKTHLATALGVAGITQHGKKVRLFSTIDLANALEQEKLAGKSGRIAMSLVRMDVVILDERSCNPLVCVPTRGARSDLHDQCHRERQCAATQDHQNPRSLPNL